MTNVRLHVQLKGTDGAENSDGSVSVSIRRQNLNYLAMHPSSIFVCYHRPSGRLLIRTVDDVVRNYEHRGGDWTNQTTVTVRFRDLFDDAFQRKLNGYAIAYAKTARDTRLDIITQPPQNVACSLEDAEVDLPVPVDRQQAEDMLAALYDNGLDRTISRSFDKFRAVLGSSNPKFILAYMSEINLGINGQGCNKSRITDGINVFYKALDSKLVEPGSSLYCIAQRLAGLVRRRQGTRGVQRGFRTSFGTH